MRRTIRGRGERGTSAIELVLVMPFLVAVLAIVVNLGYGQHVKLRVDMATRLASDTFIAATNAGASQGSATGSARSAVTEHYFGEAVRSVTASTGQRQGASGQGQPWDTIESALSFVEDMLSAVNTVSTFLSGEEFVPLSKSQETTNIEVKLEAPMWQAVFTGGNAKGQLVTNAATWTFDEWSLLETVIPDILNTQIPIFGSVPYLFGLAGVDGCL